MLLGARNQQWLEVFVTPAETKLQYYWRAVAGLFSYRREKDDRFLWSAKDDYLKSQPLPFGGYDSLETHLDRLEQWSEQNLSEEFYWIRKLIFNKDAVSWSEKDLENLWTKFRNPSLASLDALLPIVSHQPDLELDLRRRSLKSRPVSNQELYRWQELAKTVGDADLGLQIASVLKSRHALTSTDNNLWLASGASLTRFPPKKIDAQMLSYVLGDHDAKTRELCLFFFKFGDEFLSWTRLSSPQQSLAEKSCSHHLGLLAALPPEVSSCLQNPWTDVLAELALSSGVNEWDWDIQIARDRIKGLDMGKLKDETFLPFLGNQLSFEDQLVWKDALLNLNEYDPNAFKENFLLFLSKLALEIYPAEYQALESVKEINFSLSHVRAIEAWLLK